MLLKRFISLRKKYNQLLKKVGISTLDQAIRSGTRFLTALFLIKTVTKADYGYYSLMIPITLFIMSFQTAIITMPMMVLYAEKNKAAQSEYLSSLIISQIFFISIIALLTILTGVSLLIVELISKQELFMLISVTVAIIGLLSQQFLRTFYFTKLLPQFVIRLDIAYFLILFALTLFIYFIFMINVAFIFILLGVSSFLVSSVKIRSLISHTDLNLIIKHLKENWIHGRWVLAGVIISHIQSYSYIYMLGFLVSTEAVAEVSAARLLMMPMAFLSIGWSSIAIPRGSHLKVNNKINLFFKEQILISFLFSLLIILYTIIFIITPENWKNIILSETYKESYNYLVYFGILFAIGFFGQTGRNGLQVLKNFAVITKISFVTMIIVVVSSYFLIIRMGIIGGLLVLILGNFLGAISVWIFFLKDKKRFTND